jgi:enoyl-CoA hydratase/carnithine racemase
LEEEPREPNLVRVDRTGEIALLTLDKPPVNALYIDLFDAVTGALDGIEQDDAVRVVILTGGARIFSAGMDLKAVGRARPEELLRLMEVGYAFFQRMERFPKPTIAAIRGHALGGGLGLAVACDFRIAGEGAVFGMPEGRIGFPLLWGVTSLFMRTMSRGPALDLLLTGRNIDAAEGLRLSILRSVVPDGRVLDEARALARQIIENVPPFAPRSIKGILYEAARETCPRKIFDIENRYIAETVSRIDLAAWMKDYLAKKR